MWKTSAHAEENMAKPSPPSFLRIKDDVVTVGEFRISLSTDVGMFRDFLVD